MAIIIKRKNEKIATEVTRRDRDANKRNPLRENPEAGNRGTRIRATAANFALIRAAKALGIIYKADVRLARGTHFYKGVRHVSTFIRIRLPDQESAKEIA